MDGTKGLKTYASGDLVGYKIAFGNSGSAVAAMVSIKDYLPQNLNYVSSQLYINSSYSTGQYLSGGAFVDAYSGITLPSGGSGYLLLTGRVTSAYSDQTTNFVYIYLNNQFIAYDDVAYTFTPPNKHLKITKTVDNSDVNVGDEVTFILRVLNDGEVPMTGFDVLDTFPTDDFTFISQNSSGFTFERKGRMFSWGNYQGVLQPKDFIEIKFTIKLTKVGEYTNWACMTHEDFPDWKSDRQNRENCDPADVNVREKLFCKMTSPSNDSVYYVDGNNKAKVKITCGSSNGASATIKINC